jgi:hypothetical protein
MSVIRMISGEGGSSKDVEYSVPLYHGKPVEKKLSRCGRTVRSISEGGTSHDRLEIRNADSVPQREIIEQVE